MYINQTTRDEIARLVKLGYNKGFAKDGNDEPIIWEIIIRKDN